MSRAATVVIGIDGGGTHTRALCADLAGNVLGYAQTGGAHPGKNPDAQSNVHGAITAALARAGRAPGDVTALVAGIAGFDRPERDEEWAQTLTGVPGLGGSRQHVNDAVVAHAGAFGTGPGIIAISGTGSIVLGVTPGGRHVRNYDFQCYNRATARDLGYAAVFRILAGEAGTEDRPLVDAVLAHWNVADPAGLCALAQTNHAQPAAEIMRGYGTLAPIVTRAAAQNVPLARGLCDALAAELALGVGVVGACFPDPPAPVPVALIGAVVRSAPVNESIRRSLQSGPPPGRYRVVLPELGSAAGAVLMALERAGVAVHADEASKNVRAALARYPEAVAQANKPPLG